MLYLGVYNARWRWVINDVVDVWIMNNVEMWRSYELMLDRHFICLFLMFRDGFFYF